MSSGDEGQRRPAISASTRWVLAGTVLAKPLQLAMNVMLARLLGPAAFGYLSLANTTAMTLSGIAGLGMGEAASKFIAENYRRARPTAVGIAALIIWFSLALGVVVFSLAWFLRDFWALRVFHLESLDGIVALCLMLGLLNLLFSLSVNMFTGLQSFRDVTVLSALQAALVFILSIALTSIYGLTGALSGSILGCVACLYWAALRLRRIEPGLLSRPSWPGWPQVRELFRFSLPTWIAAFVANPVILFAFSYLALQPNGTHELGVFNTANALKMIVAMLPSLVGSPIGPAIMEEAGRHGSIEAYEALLRNAFAALAFLTIPLAVALLLLSDVIFTIYGSDYSEAYLLFMPLTAGIALGVLSTPFQFAMVARSHTWWLLGFALAKSSVLLSLCLWWVPASLSTGLAWASFAAEAAFAVLVTEFCMRRNLAPREAGRFFYCFAFIAAVILALAYFTPAIWRWVLAIPLSGVAAAAIVRWHPAVAAWVLGVLPAAVRPVAGRTLHAIAGSAVR